MNKSSVASDLPCLVVQPGLSSASYMTSLQFCTFTVSFHFPFHYSIPYSSPVIRDTLTELAIYSYD